MGYLKNHLATVTTGIFAASLTGIWPYFIDFAPILNFIFIMAVSITWFLTLMCWLSQKSVDYIHEHASEYITSEKQILNNTINAQTTISITTSSTPISQTNVLELEKIRNELSLELNAIKKSVKLKDEEIERLNQQIANLHTLVQVESLKTELANLKTLALQTEADEK